MKSFARSLTTVIAVALSGCATTGMPFAQDNAGATSTTRASTPDAAAESNARSSAIHAGIKGCGIGAATGVAIGLLTHRLNLGSIAAGCAAGGVTAGVMEYRNQLKKAHELQGTVTVGALTTVKEKTVMVDGQSEPALDSVTIHLDHQAIRHNSPDVRKLMTRVADLADQAKDPTTISVFGSSADRTWVTAALTLKPGSSVRVLQIQSTGAPHVVLAPIPRVGA